MIFGGWSKWTHVHIFLNVKSTHLGDTFPYILYVKPSTLVEGAPNILILPIKRMHRYENFATKLWKKCRKGAPFYLKG